MRTVRLAFDVGMTTLFVVDVAVASHVRTFTSPPHELAYLHWEPTTKRVAA